MHHGKGGKRVSRASWSIGPGSYRTSLISGGPGSRPTGQTLTIESSLPKGLDT